MKYQLGLLEYMMKGTITKFEKEWGKPIKNIKRNGKIILLVGKGLFKKNIVIPINK